MSAPQVPGSEAAPVVTAPPVVTPPASPAAVSPAPAVDPNNPPWLPDRLERERRSALAELGITDPAKAKKLLADALKAEEDAKTTGEKLGTATAERDALKAEAERLRVVTAEWAGRQMMGLTAEQQTAVKALAGDDPAQQLKAITALTPTWGKAQPLPGSAPIAPTAPVPPASGTAPPPTAPGGTSVSQLSPSETYASLSKTNPFAAAEYAMANVREVFPDRQ